MHCGIGRGIKQKKISKEWLICRKTTIKALVSFGTPQLPKSIWFFLNVISSIELRSWNSHPTSSTVRPRTCVFIFFLYYNWTFIFSIQSISSFMAMLPRLECATPTETVELFKKGIKLLIPNKNSHFYSNQNSSKTL